MDHSYSNPARDYPQLNGISLIPASSPWIYETTISDRLDPMIPFPMTSTRKKVPSTIGIVVSIDSMIAGPSTIAPFCNFSNINTGVDIFSSPHITSRSPILAISGFSSPHFPLVKTDIGASPLA